MTVAGAGEPTPAVLPSLTPLQAPPWLLGLRIWLVSAGVQALSVAPVALLTLSQHVVLENAACSFNGTF